MPQIKHSMSKRRGKDEEQTNLTFAQLRTLKLTITKFFIYWHLSLIFTLQYAIASVADNQFQTENNWDMVNCNILLLCELSLLN